MNPLEHRNLIENWLYTSCWEKSESFGDLPLETLNQQTTLVLADDPSFVNHLLQGALRKGFHRVTIKETSSFFYYSTLEDFLLHPLYAMLSELKSEGTRLDQLLIFWPPSKQGTDPKEAYHQFSNWIKIILDLFWDQPLSIKVIVQQAFSILGTESLNLEQSLIAGLCHVLNEEADNLNVHIIDIVIDEWKLQNRVELHPLLQDLFTPLIPFEVAYRDKKRWTLSYQSVPLPSQTHSLLKPHGVYLILGGGGGLGITLANHLLEHWKSNIVLTGNRNFSSLENSPRLRQAMQAFPTRLSLVQADMKNQEDLKKAVDLCLKKYQKIDGIFHLAGVGGGGFIQWQPKESIDKILSPKVDGAIHLQAIIPLLNLDFVVFFSSLSSLIPEVGQAAYSAANHFLDQAAANIEHKLGVRAISINWARWKNLGMSAGSTHDQIKKIDQLEWIHPEEGMKILEKTLSSSLNQVAISPYSFTHIKQFQKDCLLS